MMKCKRPVDLLFILGFWAFFMFPCCVQAADSFIPPGHLISKGGFITTRGGTILDEYNRDALFIPASTIKLATSLAALDILGPSYRFTTEFYLKNDNELFIKGHGDPFLTSESISEIAASIKTLGIRQIDTITIDDSAFDLTGTADGSQNSLNPYDAPNSAVAVNFNTISLEKTAAGTILSGEAQTPLLPLTQEIGSQLSPGLHRVNISAYNKENGIRYTAELFFSMLRSHGIATGKTYYHGATDPQATLIYSYRSSKALIELIRDCLKYSNNFIANQLLLTCGAARFGYPANWDKGNRALRQNLTTRFGIDLTKINLHEGSGLSKKNAVTPEFLLAVLRSFTPYSSLLPEKHSILLKSGTLTGVFCYAGYFLNDTNRDPFVLLLNQPANTRDELLKILYRRYLAAGRQKTPTQ